MDDLFDRFIYLFASATCVGIITRLEDQPTDLLRGADGLYNEDNFTAAQLKFLFLSKYFGQFLIIFLFQFCARSNIL